MAGVRKPVAFDEIDGPLPGGLYSLSKRVNNLTMTLDGTPEQPELGLIARVKSVENFQQLLLKRLNLWGGILLGAFAVSGFMNGKAAEIVHTIIAGIAG